MKEGREPVTVYVSEIAKLRIRRNADARGQTVSDYIRELMTDGIYRRRERGDRP